MTTPKHSIRWISKYDKHVLKDYPFFFVKAVERQYKDQKFYQGGFMFNPDKQYKTLKGIQKYIETLLYKSFKKNFDLIELVETLEDFKAIPFINVSHTLWCNNNGNGKYIHNELWKRFQWIEGSFSITSAISKCYALRYDINVPETDVKQHAIIIVKRHINRFIREYENSYNIS